MKRFSVFIFLFPLLLACSGTDQSKTTNLDSAKILVFSKTSGFYHESIPAGIAALQKLGKEHNFEVDTTKDGSLFTLENLSNYDAVVFLNTTGDVLNRVQEEQFENYIKNGGGFVGIHSASDTEKDWNWYIQLVGAQFINHPKIQEATIRIVDNQHLATHFLPQNWSRIDEWYNFKDINPEINVLALLDENTYKGGTNGDEHPFAWYHEFDGGRAFYTAGGHTDESYEEPLFLEHILGGIRYAIGQNYTVGE